MKLRSGFKRAVLEVLKTLRRARAGFMNIFEDMSEVNTKDRKTNFVGSLAMDGISRSDCTPGGRSALWNCCLVERWRRKAALKKRGVLVSKELCGKVDRKNILISTKLMN